ncbi:tRNA-specific adenosine deaminase [Saccharospirillum sp. MSK14-1]|uniref:tRNA adenosine(34) deaminase TadA n=1 Tax=Saccharospirillum sp. MSK14-1 TaxID=1897632 RepID=UPI000D366013|nr:tRNA adenosine(34) deaminase TadA [Saccharospirillum sp. MSK14-1]PTY36108.1 tRNA-specific adenosine deaminase [Saccharospirillum sp. MSK14-1]
MDDSHYMRLALAQAQRAYRAGEVPVGAVVVQDHQVIAEGFNEPIGRLDPSAHAEMVAIRNAAQAVGNYRLSGATLYVTVEPCTMCAGLLVHSRINRLVYGAAEPKSGAVRSNLQLFDAGPYNHHLDVVGGVLEDECAELMSRFFAERRARQKALKKSAG